MASMDPKLNKDSVNDRRALVFDFDTYRPQLAQNALTHEQETILLRTLWLIMIAVVDLRLGLHPAPQRADGVGDIPLDQLLAAMLTSSEENAQN